MFLAFWGSSLKISTTPRTSWGRSQKLFTQLTLQAEIDSRPSQAHAEYRRAQERAWYGAGAHWGTLASTFLVAFNWATVKLCFCRAVMPWMKLLFEPKKTCDAKSLQRSSLVDSKSECEAVNLEILRLWSSKKPSGQGSYFDSVLLASLSTLVTGHPGLCASTAFFWALAK